jgi:hypothetical protein
MEVSGNALYERMTDVSDAMNKLNSAMARNTTTTTKILQNCKQFWQGNPGYSKMKAISDASNRCGVQMPQETSVSHVQRLHSQLQLIWQERFTKKVHKSEIQIVETILVSNCTENYGKNS